MQLLVIFLTGKIAERPEHLLDSKHTIDLKEQFTHWIWLIYEIVFIITHSYFWNITGGLENNLYQRLAAISINIPDKKIPSEQLLV